jgi:predicted translin family RNA/ssDNA-binding protein
MGEKVDLKEIDSKIQSMKKAAEELKQMAESFPALYRNSSRILASIKMLELNISDITDL